MSKFLKFALTALALLPASAAVAGNNHPYPGADHDTLGECYDYVVTQYNDNGDEEGLDWGLDNCDDAYAEMVATMPIGRLKALRKSKLEGGLLLPAVVPGSLIENEGGDDRRRR